MSKCRPWLLAELLRVKPEVLVCLGGTAAKSLIDPGFRVMDERGLVERPDLAPRVVATVHPSMLLRQGNGEGSAEWEVFVGDLRLAVG